ncbi:MAG: TolC family protein [Bdellovibrionales bacterium]|nr:TolC family protein [Bdellovibrionales bacterium]
MQNLKHLLIFFILNLVPLNAQGTTNLKQLFSAARSYTAKLKDKTIEEEIAKKEKSKVMAGVLPSLSATSSNVWRDQADVGAFGEGYQRTSYLTLSQPLFQGGAEYYALKIAGQLPEIARLERKNEELNLYNEVAGLFYTVVRLRQNQTTYKEQEETLFRRVATLKQRAKIGRNKQTDVLSAESQLARVRAELSQIESQLIRAEQNLLNLTGVSELGSLSDDLDLNKLEVPLAWQNTLLETPRIRAAELALENSKKEVGVARSQFLPSVDLDANYYIERSGILKDSDWDVTINAKWNLFSGGEDISEKQIKDLEMRKLENYFLEEKRNIKNNFESLTKEFHLQKAVVAKLEQAVKLAEKNYKQHIKEANQGLVSHLDVLKVLEDYLQVRQNYDQQLYNAKVTWANLETMAGVLP